MENVALNLLPLLHTNAITGGLVVNTGTEAIHKIFGGKSEIPALMEDLVYAGVFGAATLLLPEIGIHSSPELAFYAAMIGFNLPAILKVKNHEQAFSQSSLIMGTTALALGAVSDILQNVTGTHSMYGISFNVSQFVKNGLQYFSSLKTH